MNSNKTVAQWTFWMANTSMMAALALGGCAGDRAMEETGAADAASIEDGDAIEAVRAACDGAYKNQGQCMKCVTSALNDLEAEGEIDSAQHDALVSALVGECSDACFSTSCAIEGKECGEIPDGCGGTLDCGGCPGTLSCGGGGTPNVCGQVAEPEVCDGVDRNGDGRWDAEVPSVCPTIQSALDVATLPGTIRVAPGIYHENLHFKGAPVTVLAPFGPAVTTIDAGQNGPAVTIDQGEGPDSVLDGFTLTNGSGAPGLFRQEGGGILVRHSSPTLRNLVVTGNEMSARSDSGGGAFLEYSDVTIENSVFTNNHVPYYGGGLHLSVSRARLDHVVVDGNTATYGAGIALYYSSIDVTNAALTRNTGYWGGGAFIQGNGGSTFTNVSMVQNAGALGGAIATYADATVDLVNVTMSGGAAWQTTGGVYAHPGGTIRFDHCNFWDNAGGDVGGLPSPIGADGNVSVDPGFVDTSSPQSLDWDLHLTPLSPLRNAGTPALQNHDGTVSDIGAYGGPGGDW
jgi:hypothetical protein